MGPIDGEECGVSFNSYFLQSVIIELVIQSLIFEYEPNDIEVFLTLFVRNNYSELSDFGIRPYIWIYIVWLFFAWLNSEWESLTLWLRHLIFFIIII
jgi:hypothetical protein